MKSRPNPFLRYTAAVAIAFTASASAADLTWDAGTSANWNTTDDNWTTAATWNNSTPDNAIFNTNTGTITLTEAITAGNFTFGLTNANLTGAFAGSALTVNGNLTAQADNTNGTGHLILSFANNVNVLGDVAINRGVMQVTGGTFTANRIGSTNAWGRLLVSGGSVTATNGVDDSVLGGGVAMSVFLEGGTLSTPYIKTTSATWTGLGDDGVVLNGGTLRATANSTDFIQVWDPGGWGIRNNVGVGPNGAIIDTNGFDITINRTLQDYGGAGALTKNGAGKLTLVWSGHSGGTTVNAGTLEYSANSGYSLLRNALTVNAGGTVSVLGDGTGLGWQGGSMVTTLNINGGTVTSPGTMHVWNIGGGVNMTGGTLQSNNGVSNANGPQLEWSGSTVNTNASPNTATIGGRIRMRADFGSGITFNVADGAAASDLLVSAAITEASGGQGITKNGAGTMTITGVSSYTGGTVINGGVLEVSSMAGGTSNIGSQWLALDNTSTLHYTGTGSETSTRDIWINNAAGTRTFDIANAGGTLTLAGGGGQINKDIRKAGAGTLVLDKVVSDAASVTVDGGTLTLTAANTYTGPTSVTAGTLNLTGSLTSNVAVSGGGIGGEGLTTGTLTLTGASTLSFDPTTGGFLRAASADASGGTVTLVPTGGATGTGIVVLEALGGITGAVGTNFVFTGRGNSYLNGTNTQLLFDFTPGSLVWKGNDGTNPTFWDVNATTNWTLGGSPDKFQIGDSVTFDDTATSFNVAVQGTSIIPGGVTFNNTTAYTLSGGGIAGSGGLTKSGSGSVTIKSANTYTGATVINAGTLQLGDGTGGNDGSLATSGVTNDGTLAYNLNGNQTAGYAISGNGALTKTGAGTLTLTAANSYTGATTVSGGVLKAGNASAFGGSGSTITVNSGGALDLDGQNLQAYTNAIVLNGAGIDANTGALFNSGGLQTNGVRYISLGSDATIGGNGGRFDLGRDHTGTVNQGNGHVLTKVGSNTVSILNTSSSFSGVVINGGMLIAETDTALAAAPVTINNGGTLATWGGRTLSNELTINTGGVLRADAGFNDTYTGLVHLGGAATVDTASGNITLSGAVDGAGNLNKVGGSRLILSGNNTQTGTLYVSGGHVQFASGTGNATQGNVEMLNPGSFLLMGAPNQFGPNSGLLFNSPGHSEFALYGNNQTIASLASTNGYAVVQNSHGGFGPAAASSTLTVNQSTDTTYYGVFRDNTGDDAFTLALVKEGAGKLTMATNTSHTGGTTVNGGVLEIAGSSGGNSYLRGTATVNAGGELRFTGGDGTGFGYNGGNKIDTLNINGGLVDSTNTAHLYNANVNMTGGELRVSAGTIMWNFVTVNTSASANTALINSSITLRADGGFNNSIFNVADGTAATDLQVSGPISELLGTVGLTKSSAGTMTLTGANSYTGNTTINGGTLKIAEGASIYNGGYNNGAVLTVNNGGTLELNRWGYGPGAANQSLGGLDYNPARFVINGGTVKYTGGAAGAPTDPGEAPYGPGFTIGALGATLDAAKVNDTWTVKNDSRGFGPIASNDGGTLTLTGVGNGVFDKELGGTGGVVKNGSGTWELNRTNTYTGNTVVAAGSLSVASTGSLRFRPTNNGATNSVSGSGTGSLSFLGTVDLDLGAADLTNGNTWTLFDLGSFTTTPDLSATAAVTSTLGSFTEGSAGTWELPVINAKWVFTESNGQLTYVVTATDYDTWKSANGVTGGENDDDDSDGLTNHEEYAFGLDPTGGSEVNPIAVPLNKTAGTFSYTRRLQSLTGLTYSVWYSTDLSGWTEDTAAVQGTPSVSGEVETVPVTLTGSLLTNPKLFIQVRAE